MFYSRDIERDCASKHKLLLHGSESMKSDNIDTFCLYTCMSDV